MLSGSRTDRRKTFIFLFFSCFLVLFCGTVAALDPTIHPRHANRRVWTEDDGLPQNSVQALLQDRAGYLWLGTQEGLARFDGVQFTVLDSRSPSPLPSNNVLSLLEDASGAIWVGLGGGGLGRVVDRAGGLVFEPLPWFNGQNVRALLLDRRRRLWVGTRSDGLWRLDDADAAPERVEDVDSAMILSLAETSDGAVWVGTEEHGLYRLAADGDVDHFDDRHGLGSPNVWALLEDHRGLLWIGTHGGGLSLWDGVAMSGFGLRDGLTSERVTTLAEDRDGSLWIGTRGGGLMRMRAGRIEALSPAEGIASEVVMAVLEDREGLLWLGSAGQGLVRLSDSPFDALHAASPDAEGTPRVVLEDRTGTMWVGTSDRGLLRTANGRLTTAGIPPGGPPRDAFSLLEDRGGALWVGTYGDGLWRLKDGRWRSWRARDGLPNETVWALAEDHSGRVWVGTHGGGVARIENDAVELVDAGDTATSRLVRTLLPASDGRIWIGSGAGLRVHDSANSTTIPIPGPTTATVYAIHEDGDGNLWVGTNGHGLWMVDRNGGVGVVTTTNGLHDNLVYTILEDDAGFLWMTCNRGLFRAHRRDLLRVARGLAEQVECTVFGRHDGMPAAECNGGSQPAGWVGRDGRVWIPTIRGVVALDPRRLRTDPRPPPLRIERTLVDGVPAAAAGALVLPSTISSLEIRYTALSLIAPDRIRFSYRMDGLDTDWIAAGGRRAAYYSRLPPGEYRFEVQAATAAGVWSPQPESLAIVVEPRLYQRPLFFTGCAALLILAGFGAASLRTARLRERQRTLGRLVEERTRELLAVTRQLGEANQRLEELSLQDALTGVANRRSFDRMLDLLWAQSQRRRTTLGLLMIDVDHFKAFNDRYGHPAGDRCLVEVAEILSQRLRRSSDLIARYGGEEFAVILDGATESTLNRLAEEIRAEVEARAIPHEASPTPGVVTISVGGAWAVADRSRAATSLTAAADEALYRAKRAGRNRIDVASLPGAT